MTAGGDFTCSAWSGTKGSFIYGLGQVEFTGTFTFQNNPIYDEYYDLKINGGTVSMARATIINRHLTLSSGSFDGSGKPLTVKGNWNNTDGSFIEGSASNSKVTFDGGNAQTITTVSGETFHHLIINKSANEITLNDNIELSGPLNRGMSKKNQEEEKESKNKGFIFFDVHLYYLKFSSKLAINRRFCSLRVLGNPRLN